MEVSFAVYFFLGASPQRLNLSSQHILVSVDLVLKGDKLTNAEIHIFKCIIAFPSLSAKYFLKNTSILGLCRQNCSKILLQVRI